MPGLVYTVPQNGFLRSQNITLLYFYLWGRIHALVNILGPLNTQDFCVSKIGVLQRITHHTLETVSRNKFGSARMCIFVEGRCFKTNGLNDFAYFCFTRSNW